MKCPHCGNGLIFRPASKRNYSGFKGYRVNEARVRECYCHKCMSGFYTSEKVVPTKEQQELKKQIEKIEETEK